MKKVSLFILGFIALSAFAVGAADSLFGLHFAFLHLGDAAVSLAMFAPVLPMASQMGVKRPLVNRAIMLNDGTWGPGGETLHYPVYDRRPFSNALATATRTLFKTAVGQQREGATLTYADTNIEKSEGVPNSQKWTFWRIKAWYLAAAAQSDANLQAFLNYIRTTSIRCTISSKDDMFRVPLWKFFGATQIVSAPAVTVNSRYPQALFYGEWEFKVPIILQALTDWALIEEPLVASAAGIDANFICYEFDGQRDRLT